jgi:hypothetical protein
LVKSISINADAKRFIQATCKDFFDWVEEGNLALSVYHYNSAKLQEFISEFTGFKDLEPRRFLKWVQSYADFKGLKMTKGRNHNGRYFELESEQSTPPTDGDVWDELNNKAKEL